LSWGVEGSRVRIRLAAGERLRPLEGFVAAAERVEELLSSDNNVARSQILDVKFVAEGDGYYGLIFYADRFPA